MPVVTRSRARGERVRTAPTRTSARIRNRNARGRGRGRGRGARGRARPGANRFQFQSPPRLVSRRRPRRGEAVDDVDTEEFTDYSTEEYESPTRSDQEAEEAEGDLGPFDIHPVGPLIREPNQVSAYIESHEDRGRSIRPPRDQIVAFFQGLFPINTTITSGSPLHLGGLSLRELCEMLDEAALDRRGLYISGTCVDYQFSRRPGNGGGLPIGGVSGVSACYQVKRIINVPMSEIVWDDTIDNWPSDQLPLRYFLGATASRIMSAEVVGSGEIPSSVFIINDDVRITRSALFPSRYQGIYQFRTGGFDRLLLHDMKFEIPLPAAIGAYYNRQPNHSGPSSPIYVPSTIGVYIPGSSDRVLAKLPNCIVQCLAFGLYDWRCQAAAAVIGAEGRSLSSEEKRGFEIEAAFEAKSLYNRFYSQWFDDKVNEYWASKANVERTPALWQDYRRHIARLKSNWERLIVHGFSNVLLRRFVRFLCGFDICLDVLLFDRTTQRYVRAGEASVISTDLRRTIDYPYAGRSPLRTVLCLQVNLDGEVQTTDILENPPTGIPILDPESGSGFHSVYGKDVFPGLLHCIALFPPSLSPILRREETLLAGLDQDQSAVESVQFALVRSALHTGVGKRLAETFRVSREFNLEIGEDEMSLRTIVDLQRTRMEACSKFVPRSHFTSASTSYSSERARDVEVEDAELISMASASSSSTIARLQALTMGPIGVVVYDCETVENLRGCQDRVSPHFRKTAPPLPDNVPSHLRNAFTVPQSHIPYTVQWGLVDMMVDIRNIRDPHNILVHNAVHICYGGHDRYLGDCIEEFLISMHAEAVSLGLKKIYCYAHNGCGFDSYMILHYVHSKELFRFRDVLITSRGILSIELEALIGGKKISFIFRDTKLFFNASLSDLCKIFKVPSQFCKTDFPITRVHARNYFRDEFVSSVREYMENDVWSLAFICRGINDIIRDNILHTREELLPITKNVTLMSLVTYLQRCEFVRNGLPSPFACDLPCLRNLVCYANMGGRVLPFWRDYESSFAMPILDSYYKDLKDGSPNRNRGERAEFYQRMIDGDAFGKVMDVTSLYPYAMSHYPMPVGLIRSFVNAESLFYGNIVEVLDCVECHRRRTLCSIHLPGGEANLGKSLALGHFVFFVIRDIRPPRYDLSTRSVPKEFANFCPRKTSNGESLVYSFETPEEYSRRTFDKVNLPSGVSCFTMYDLYWMHKTGWKFAIVGAFGFESNYIYRDSLLSMFEERKLAKRREREEGLPKSLSTMWKNVYNGGYGINARQDITKQHILCGGEETEDSLRARSKLNPDEILVRDAANSFQLPNEQWLLKIKKHVDSAEYFAKQSPNHIGAAVTSTSRHHMNLFLYSLSTDEYGYTDTDSVFITGKCWKRMCFETPWLVDESPEAAMGTYKNDHEGPGNESVILSFMIAKKVKLHVTLNAEGDLHFHETFKGFNPSKMDAATNLVHTSEYLLYQKVLALSQIYFFGTLQDNFQQTEWRRSLSAGITVIGEKPFSIDPKVYSTDNGECVLEHFQNNGENGRESRHTLWIPHGYLPDDHNLVYFLWTPEEHQTICRRKPLFLLWNAILSIWGRTITRYALPEDQDELQTLFTEVLPTLTPSDYTWS